MGYKWNRETEIGSVTNCAVYFHYASRMAKSNKKVRLESHVNKCGAQI